MPLIDSAPTLPPWKKRLVLSCLIIGGVTALILLAGLTWAIFAIREDRAGMQRVPARIVSVDSSQRSSFGRGIKFGKYNLTVRYKDSDGHQITDKVEKTTFGFPSAGDSITLLIHPSGRLESNPFPEVTVIVALVYGFFAWMLWLVIRYVIPVLRHSHSQQFVNDRSEPNDIDKLSRLLR